MNKTIINCVKNYTKPGVMLACSILGIMLILYGMYIAITQTPDDYLQGAVFRIIYVHVPCAWFSLLLYAIMAVFCVMYLSTKSPIYIMPVPSLVKFGCLYTAITLATGSIWGLPTWGTWWVWDARLTSMLILLIIYISLYVLLNTIQNEIIAAKACAVYAIIGAINIPIIKFSVNIWYTLHQGQTFFNLSGDSFIHESMQEPIIFTCLGLALYSLGFIAIDTRAEVMRKKAVGRSLLLQNAQDKH